MTVHEAGLFFGGALFGAIVGMVIMAMACIASRSDREDDDAR